MKILEEIKNEHDQVREFFLQMENDEEKAPEIFKELATFVLAHHDSEEKTVFTELSKKKDVQKTKNHLIAEHASIRRAIQIILDTPDDDKMWEPNVHVAKDIIAHHVDEEEEELFEILRKEKSEKELAEIYKAFEAHFNKVKPDMKKNVKDKKVYHPEDCIPKPEKAKADKPKSEKSKAK